MEVISGCWGQTHPVSPVLALQPGTHSQWGWEAERLPREGLCRSEQAQTRRCKTVIGADDTCGLQGLVRS
jgi:hypothetical protein